MSAKTFSSETVARPVDALQIAAEILRAGHARPAGRFVEGDRVQVRRVELQRQRFSGFSADMGDECASDAKALRVGIDIETMDKIVGAKERENADQRIARQRQKDVLFLGEALEVVGLEIAGRTPGESRRAGALIKRGGVRDVQRITRGSNRQCQRIADGHGITSAWS